MGKEQKIKQCKSCGKQLDKSAKICPSCGKDQRTFFGKHKILTGILVLLIIGAIGGGSEDKTPSTEQASSGKTDTEVSNQNKNEKNNGAGGMGAKITPSAVIVITGDNVQLINIKNQDAVNKLIDMAPGIASKLNFGAIFNKNTSGDNDIKFEEETIVE